MMKKWLPIIIYKLFRYLFEHFFTSKAMDSNETGSCATAPVKAPSMPVILHLKIVGSASGDKTLWRHTVFQRGISASIN